MNSRKSLYHRYRFPQDIIRHAVWLYYRFCLSYRDVEDLLAERGINVSYETVRRLMTDKLRSYAPAHRDVMPGTFHDTRQYANNRAEVSHEPTR